MLLGEFVPTCMFVVGRGLWSLRAATLLEKEGGSLDHEEALAEAEKQMCKRNSVMPMPGHNYILAISSLFFFILYTKIQPQEILNFSFKWQQVGLHGSAHS